MAKKNKDWLNVPQVADIFDVDPDTIRRYVEQGRLKPANKPSPIVQRQHWYFEPEYINQILKNGLPAELPKIPQDQAAWLRDTDQISATKAHSVAGDNAPAATNLKAKDEADTTIAE